MSKNFIESPAPPLPQTMLPGGDHYLTPALALRNFEINWEKERQMGIVVKKKS